MEIFIIVVLIVAWLGIVYWEIKQTGLKDSAIKFILEAEKTLENNDEKFELVCENVVKLLPNWLEIFITPAMIEKLVQRTFDSIKDVLDYKGKGEPEEKK